MFRYFLLALVLAACSSAREVAPTVSTSTPAIESPSTQATTTTASPETTSSTEATTTTTIAPLQSLQYKEIGSVPYPVQVVSLPGAGRSYVVSKDGTVWVLSAGVIGDQPVLDISNRVRDQREQGLLSAAINANDPSRLFLHYTGDSGQTIVSEFELISPVSADPDSEQVWLTLSQPARNHNGGMIQFDSNGGLIVALGDGGGANDRYGNGQDTSTLLGGLVRIDLTSGEAELFNHGLRNPWRFWIEGDMIYIADVGQGAYEEVNVAPFQAGLNFGWPITEGLHCFSPATGCSTAGITLPVVEVSHGDAGSCSITGGLVYNGYSIPEIEDHYFYSDYCGGYLRSLRIEDGSIVDQVDWTDDVGIPGRVTGFGVDGVGEIYVTTETTVFKLVASR